MSRTEKAKPAGSIGRTAAAGLLFIVGLDLTLSGLLAFSALAYQFLKWKTVHVLISPPGGRVLLAWGMIGISGIAWCLASYYCATRNNRKTAMAVVFAGLLWFLFYLIFPGPVPL
jgi:hypothetical protein